MRTQADEKVEAAKEHIRGAIENLAAVVVLECHGTEDFSQEYLEALQASLNDLMLVRARLR